MRTQEQEKEESVPLPTSFPLHLTLIKMATLSHKLKVVHKETIPNLV